MHLRGDGTVNARTARYAVFPATGHGNGALFTDQISDSWFLNSRTIWSHTHFRLMHNLDTHTYTHTHTHTHTHTQLTSREFGLTHISDSRTQLTHTSDSNADYPHHESKMQPTFEGCARQSTTNTGVLCNTENLTKLQKFFVLQITNLKM